MGTINVNKIRLPEEYQQVEWIESSGEQYINTGYTLTSDDSVTIKLNIIQHNDNDLVNYIFGRYSSNYKFALQANTTSMAMLYNTWDSSGGFSTYEWDTINTITVDNTGLYKNGKLQQYQNSEYEGDSGYNYVQRRLTNKTFSTDDSAYIFWANGTSRQKIIAKLYDFIIKRNGVETCHMIPCYRKSDGVIGLYDIVRKRFDTNSGTGTFVRGDNITNTINVIPKEYQELEWIESSGEQYIITNLTYVYGYKIRIETLDGEAPSGGKGYFGWWNDASQCNLQSYDSDGIYRKTIITRGTNNNVYPLGGKLDCEISVNGKTITANGLTFEGNAVSPDMNIPFALFGYNRINGVVNCEGKCRIFYAKFYNQNEQLIGNFIPCERIVDGVLGMYDTVTQKFFTNSGTGTFIKGVDAVNTINVVVERELPPQYQRVEYIQSTGSQVIVINDNFNTDILFEMKCQIDAMHTTQVVVGQSARGGYWFGASADDTYGVGSISTNINIGSKSNILLKYGISQLYATIDGVNKNGQSYSEGGHRALTIFGAQGGSMWFYSYAKIYSFKADGVVNLIPCYRISDGEIGMYDTVTQRFLTNSGTGKFIKGANVVADITKYKGGITFNTNNMCNIESLKYSISTAQDGSGDPSFSNIRNLRGCNGVVIKTLPDEYQAVEYVENNGWAYIILNYTPQKYDEFHIKYMIYESDTMSCMLSAGTGNYQLVVLGTSGSTVDYLVRYFNTIAPRITTQLPINTWDVIDINKDGVISSNNMTYQCNYISALDGNNTNLYVFRRNDDNNPFMGRISEFYIKRNGRYQIYLVPCYRKSDNEIGFYDLVSDVFYVNQTTVYSFTKGNNINTPSLIMKIDEAHVGETNIIDWTDDVGTVYGGYIDLSTGVLVKTHDIIHPTSVWENTYETNVVSVGFYLDDALPIKAIDILSNIAYSSFWITSTILEKGIVVYKNVANNRPYICIAGDRSIYPTWQDLRDAILNSDSQFIYPLNTPITYNLNQLQLKSIVGKNTFVYDNNDNIDIRYKKENAINIPAIHRKVLLNSDINILQNEYKRVEYIIGVGTGSVIDTGINGNNDNLRFVFDCETDTVGSYSPMFGNYVNEQSDSWRLITMASSMTNGFYVNRNRITNDSAGLYVVEYSDYKDKRLHFDISRSSASLTYTETYSLREDTKSHGTENNTNIAIGNNRVASGASGNRTIKWWYFQIYDSGKIIRNYIPCYRKSDNRVGFYDTVNYTFNPSIGDTEFILE